MKHQYQQNLANSQGINLSEKKKKRIKYEVIYGENALTQGIL